MTYYNYLGQPMPESATETGNILGTPAGNETVQAPAGDTSVSGNGGGDVLVGSPGDNRYWITDPRDQVVDANGGVDTEIGWTSIKLAPNVQNLIVHKDFNYAVGNNLDNLIETDGSQWVDGGIGNDVLVGSVDQRTSFIEQAGQGDDVIYNWNGNDQIQFLGYGLQTAADVRAAMTQVGSDVVIRLSSTESLTIRNTTPASFYDRQFLLPLDASKLGAMTFDDEFNSLSVLNPNTGAGQWRTNFGGNLKDQWAYTLTTNGEDEVYVQPGFQGQGNADLGVNPFAISNGVLSITAAPSPDTHATYFRDYTSGMLNTLGMFEQKYGYFEVRAQVPNVAGTWPAFWLMPSPYQPNMEADVFEGLGATPNVDYRRAWGGDGDQQTMYDNVYRPDPTGFHTYGMLWTPTTTTFYYDGTAVLTGPTPSTWTSPMSLVLNLAVGGWGGTPDASGFPASMQVDYVHVYALADGSSQVVHETPDLPVDTLVDDGATGGQSPFAWWFQDGSAPLSSGHIALTGAPASGAAPAHSLAIWETSGAVYGAVSNGTGYGAPMGLTAGSIGQFTGAGTWLTTGKVVTAYYAANASGGVDLWDVVIDPAHNTIVKQDLGAAAGTGAVDFVATTSGGFAVSWHAPDGTVSARGYDEYAYGGDTPGWYGPTRTITGDLQGVNAQGQLYAANGAGQELYHLLSASITDGSAPATGSGGGGSSLHEIDGGASGESIAGTAAGDFIRGMDGNDTVDGGGGDDDVNGNKGEDIVQGADGADSVRGGQGGDTVYGASGDDPHVNGNLGNDLVYGGQGNDTVYGGQGDDTVHGDLGNDLVSGDLGNDALFGGGGADTFAFRPGARVDWIEDFNAAEGDRILLPAGWRYTLTATSDGQTLLDFGGGDVLALAGVSPSQFSADWIVTA